MHTLPETLTLIAQLLHTPEFYEQCTAQNVSSYDAALIHECSSATTLAPQAVPIPQVSLGLG